MFKMFGYQIFCPESDSDHWEALGEVFDSLEAAEAYLAKHVENELKDYKASLKHAQEEEKREYLRLKRKYEKK